MEITPGAAILYPLLYFFDADGWFAALLPGVILHELGHAAALRLCGGEAASLRLEITGLCLDILPLTSSAAEILCCLAGPAAGLLWIPLARTLPGVWWRKSADAALVINLFNLLPALPLDGGKALELIARSWTALLWGSVFSAGVLTLAAWGSRRPELLLPAGFLLFYAVRSA